MRQLSAFTENYEIKKSKTAENSERAEIVKQFVEELNTTRRQNGYKPLSAKFYAIKMAEAGLKTNHDLYRFLAQCREANDFSKYWWWALNPRNVK